jgi:hypothetical protein
MPEPATPNQRSAYEPQTTGHSQQDAADINQLDHKDYTVLHICHQADTPPWKARIHDTYNDATALPTPSIQTIGRRVDTLINDNLLAPVIVSPDDTPRDLLKGHELTTIAQHLLPAIRRLLLEDIIHTELFTTTRTDHPDAFIRHLLTQLTGEQYPTEDRDQLVAYAAHALLEEHYSVCNHTSSSASASASD